MLNVILGKNSVFILDLSSDFLPTT